MMRDLTATHHCTYGRRGICVIIAKPKPSVSMLAYPFILLKCHKLLRKLDGSYAESKKSIRRRIRNNKKYYRKVMVSESFSEENHDIMLVKDEQTMHQGIS